MTLTIQERDQLFHNHMYLVRALAKYYSKLKHRSYYEDICQEGYIGLLKSCETFDESFECEFGMHATMHIKGHMRLFMWRQWGFIHGKELVIPQWILRFFNKHHFNVEWTPTDEQMMEEYSITKERASRVRSALCSFPRTTNDYYPISEEISSAVHLAIATMPTKEKEILVLRYGFEGDEPHAWRRIAEITQIKETTARMRMNLGLLRLKEKLNYLEWSA
jgi:RNA polymerase sigma factor (sigma-70 family)